MEEVVVGHRPPGHSAGALRRPSPGGRRVANWYITDMIVQRKKTSYFLLTPQCGDLLISGGSPLIGNNSRALIEVYKYSVWRQPKKKKQKKKTPRKPANLNNKQTNNINYIIINISLTHPWYWRLPSTILITLIISTIENTVILLSSSVSHLGRLSASAVVEFTHYLLSWKCWSRILPRTVNSSCIRIFISHYLLVASISAFTTHSGNWVCILEPGNEK